MRKSRSVIRDLRPAPHVCNSHGGRWDGPSNVGGDIGTRLYSHGSEVRASDCGAQEGSDATLCREHAGRRGTGREVKLKRANFGPTFFRIQAYFLLSRPNESKRRKAAKPSLNHATIGKDWRRGSESNRRIKVLQTSPLPLGYRAPAQLNSVPSRCIPSNEPA